MHLYYKSFRSCYLCFLFLFTSTSTYAQPDLSRLWKLYNNTSLPDTVRLKAIKDISWEGYLYSKPDSAFYFAQMEYDLAKKKNLKKYIAEALNTQANSLFLRGRYSNAMNYHLKSLTIKEEIGDKKGVATSLNNIGLIYKAQGDNQKALEYHNKSLKIREEIKDKKGIAMSYQNLGIIYQEKGELSLAIDYFMKSLKLREELGDKRGTAGALHDIGNIYETLDDHDKALEYYLQSLKIRKEIDDKNGISETLNNVGIALNNKGQRTEAIKYYLQSLEIRKAMEDKEGIGMTLTNLANIYRDLGDKEKALNCTHEAMKIEAEIGDRQGIAFSMLNISSIYLDRKAFDESIKYGNKALKLGRELGVAVVVRDASNFLFQCYFKTGRYKEAVDMHLLFVQMKDSLVNQEKQKEVFKQEMQYRLEKQKAVAEKEKEKSMILSELKRSKERDKHNIQLGLLSAFLLVSGGTTVYWYKRNQAKGREFSLLAALQEEEIKRKQAEAELKMQQEKERISRDLHDSVGSQLTYIISQLDYTSTLSEGDENIHTKINKLSGSARELMEMLREIIWAIRKEELTLHEFSFKIKELLNRYHSSFPHIQFNFHWNETESTDISLNPTQLLNLFRIIQEAANNAIKHAQPTTVSVLLELSPDTLSLIIKDDGIGLEENAKKKEGHYGLENMETRAREMQAQFAIFSEKNKGTRIEVVLALSTKLKFV